jgi:hypothetical protein
MRREIRFLMREMDEKRRLDRCHLLGPCFFPAFDSPERKYGVVNP